MRDVDSIRTAAVAFLCAAGLFASASASAATTLNGTWVATSPSGKVELHLRGSGKSYRGTYVAGGKTSKVTVRLSNADGAGEVTLTFTSTHRSSLCGMVGGRLMCAAGTGTLVFARAR
jgi:hypothetical protein